MAVVIVIAGHSDASKRREDLVYGFLRVIISIAIVTVAGKGNLMVSFQIAGKPCYLQGVRSWQAEQDSSGY